MTTSAQFDSPVSSVAVGSNTPVTTPVVSSQPATGTLILVADDDPIVRTTLTQHLNSAGYTPITAADGIEAQERLTDRTAVALFDLKMPRADGFDCLEYTRQKFPDTPVILITSSDDVSDAVSAMKRGAFDYITKPFTPDELLARVEQAVQKANLLRDNRSLRQLVGQALPESGSSAFSALSPEAEQQIERVASSQATVLLTGESGTGKTTAARLIHERSPRAGNPFVVVNCAALPRDLIEAELFGHTRGAFPGAQTDRPGRIEAADGGTLFLDEIGDLPADVQGKLLTLLQDRTVQRLGSTQSRTVDVRLITASHQDLPEMCQNKRFREDLFYRLNVLRIQLPPVRQHLDQLEALTKSILKRYAKRAGYAELTITDSALAKLKQYHWPGNIRELENVLEQAIAFSDQGLIDEEQIDTSCGAPGSPNNPSSLKLLANRTLADVEKQAILETLEACGGNKAKTARVLGISEKSIYNKMRRHGLRKSS